MRRITTLSALIGVLVLTLALPALAGKYTTTTTLPEVTSSTTIITTTTLPEGESTTSSSTIPTTTSSTQPSESTTTTTLPPASTTTAPTTSSTDPLPSPASIAVTGGCLAEGQGLISIEIGTGVESIQLLMLDDGGDVDLFPGGIQVADGELIEKTVDVGFTTTFEVRAFSAVGFSFPNANQPDGSWSQYVTIPDCTPDTTVAPPTSGQSTSTVETLPLTGPSNWMPLTFLAVALAGLGSLMVWSARKQES